MNTIWKFKFNTTDNLVIKMPKGSKVLSVQVQGEQPCMWALVDPDAKKENRKFRIFGTGHLVPSIVEDLQFIATYQEQGGALVWHLFAVA